LIYKFSVIISKTSYKEYPYNNDPVIEKDEFSLKNLIFSKGRKNEIF